MRSLLLGVLLIGSFAAPASADVTFDCDECLHVVLQFDRSGSMFSDGGRKINRAKDGAKELVSRLKEGDAVAITTHAGSGKTALAMTTINSAADRDTINAAIDGIDQGTGNTNIGDALRMGLDELQDNRVDGCNELIVIIGDGDHGTDVVTDPETPADVIPDLVDDGVKVTTISLGDELVDLPNIASETGGCSFEDVFWWQVYQLYVRTAAAALGQGIILDSPSTEMSTGDLAEGESDSFDFEAEVPADSTVATFCIAMNKTLPDSGDPAFTVSCELESPSGDIFDTIDVSQDCCYDVFDPEPGTWTVRLVITMDTCGAGTCKAVRKTRVFASAASCPLSIADCDYSDLGDVVGVDADGLPVVYDGIQDALDEANADGLTQIFMFASETGTTAYARDLTDVDIIACGDVTIRRLKVRECENVTISGFNVDARGKTYASKIYGYSRANNGLDIVDCHFTGGYYGMLVDHDNEHINLIGCSFNDNRKYGLWFRGDGTATVSECEIDGNRSIGCRIQGVEVLFEYCDITNNGSQGIYSFCTSDCFPEIVTLVQNNFEGNDGSVGNTKDENLGNIGHIIDETDDQPGYEVTP